jgi:hypothetical protein
MSPYGESNFHLGHHVRKANGNQIPSVAGLHNRVARVTKHRIDLSSVWTMYFDGSKRVQGAGAGVVLISPQGDKLKYVLWMSFPKASNNEAK